MSVRASTAGPMAEEHEPRIIGQGVVWADGSESSMLEIMRGAADRSSGSDELARHITDWPSEYHLSPARANLLLPLRLHQGVRVLEVGSGTGALTRAVAESGARVVALDGSLDRSRVAAARLRGLSNVEIVCGSLDDYVSASGTAKFDVVLMCGVLEYAGASASGPEPALNMLGQVSKLLAPGGCLVLAIENQWGLKYILSYPEDHLGVPWVGLEGYRRGSGGINTYSRSQLASLLEAAGLRHASWLAPFPDYKLPRIVVRDRLFGEPDGVALVKLFVRQPFSPHAGAPLILADGTDVFQSACDAGLGLELANSFLVVASASPGAPEQLVGDELIWMAAHPARSKAWRHARSIRKGSTDRFVIGGESGTDESVDEGVVLRHQPAEVVIGTNAEDIIISGLLRHGPLSSDGLLGLREWWTHAAPVLSRDYDGGWHFDVLPRNFIVDADGAWHFVDLELLLLERPSAAVMAYRALLLTLHERGTGPVLLRGLDPALTLSEIVRQLLSELGLVTNESICEEWIDFELSVQQRIGAVGADSEAVRESLGEIAAGTPFDVVPSLPLARLVESTRQLGEAQRRVAQLTTQLREDAADREALGRRITESERRAESLATELAERSQERDRLDAQLRDAEARSQAQTGAISELATQRDMLLNYHRGLAALARSGIRFHPRNARRWLQRAYGRLMTSMPGAMPGYLWSNPLFDQAWYREQYEDLPPGGSAERHWRRHGVREGRNPSALFDTSWYLARYPDVASRRINPLDHYLLFGAYELRDPGPDFSTRDYLRDHLAAAADGTNALLHFMRRQAPGDAR